MDRPSPIRRLKLDTFSPTVSTQAGLERRIDEFVGIDGHFVSFEALVCVDDVEAIDKAERLIDGACFNPGMRSGAVASQDHQRSVPCVGAMSADPFRRWRAP